MTCAVQRLDARERGRFLITPTGGLQIGPAAEVGERLVERWNGIVDRRGEIVPRYGFTQIEREVAAAGRASQIAAVRAKWPEVTPPPEPEA